MGLCFAGWVVEHVGMGEFQSGYRVRGWGVSQSRECTQLVTAACGQLQGVIDLAQWQRARELSGGFPAQQERAHGPAARVAKHGIARVYDTQVDDLRRKALG